MIFWVVRAKKGAKNGPRWQKILSVALHISRIMHHSIVIFGTHVKWWHLQVLFSFFQNFDFPGCLGGGKKAKNGRKWQKILSVSLCISGTVHQMIMIFGTHVKWWYLQQYFSFFQNSFFLNFSWLSVQQKIKLLLPKGRVNATTSWHELISFFV